MKVTVNKKGKKKIYNLITSWDDVTLEKWQKIVGAEGGRVKEDIEMIKALSDIPDKILRELDLQDIVEILKLLTDLQRIETTKSVRKTYDIKGVKYGFHPNLEKLTLGEWIDIDSLIVKGISENMHYIMAILFRPIIEKKGKTYTIEAYTDSNMEERADIFKKEMNALQVRSALVFFWTLGRELKIVLERYSVHKLTQEMKKRTMTQKQHSNKNMVGTV